MRDYSYALSLLGIMMLTATDSIAVLSGQLQTTVENNNSRFRSESSIEELLDIAYSTPEKDFSVNLSLALIQQQDNSDSELYQFYLQQDFNNAADRLSLGRFFRTDTLGYYSLDGLQFRHKAGETILNFYAGIPSRIEAFRSIDGDALYGISLKTLTSMFYDYKVDARLGWQRLDKVTHEQRYHFGMRANVNEGNANLRPTALSMSASYVAEAAQWESAQLNTRWDLEENSMLRIDYETYEPVSDDISFRDRFYSLYSRGRQTQLKAAYQFKYNYQQVWSMAARQVDHEFGGEGYAGMFTIEHRSNKGLRISGKAELLELQTERVSSLFIDADKTLSSSLRGGISSVLQQQEKQLTGGNQSFGMELRLEHMIGAKSLPSDLKLEAVASHIWNSRLEDEYRVLLNFSYKFGNKQKAVEQ